MTLRQRFGILMLLLLGGLGTNTLLSVWSVQFLERELSWPLQSIHPVLNGMYQINRASDTQRSLLSNARAEMLESRELPVREINELVDDIIRLESDADRAGDLLNEHPTILLRSGVSTIQNLDQRSAAILSAAAQLRSERSSSSLDQLESMIYARHELVERVRGRVIEDTKLVADYGRRIRLALIAIIGFSIISIIACVLLAGVLVRRWITRPLETLREGAMRLGQGELEHRISIESDDEIGQLAIEFNQMATHLKRMQDERVEQERLTAMGEMAQRTVHNLRTPLSGIRSLAETTNQELPADSEIRELQTRIIETVDRFEGWLQQILQVSSPAEIRPVPLNPAELISAVASNHADAAAARGITLDIQLFALTNTVIGDPHHLEHAITAVLSNAIDFAPRGSAVEISANSDADQGYWTIRIANTGPAISQDLHASIFRPYFTTRRGGTGIGLALVKRVIVQHGGEITVESPLDPVKRSGVAFHCRIPTAWDAERTAQLASIRQGSD